MRFSSGDLSLHAAGWASVLGTKILEMPKDHINTRTLPTLVSGFTLVLGRKSRV